MPVDRWTEDVRLAMEGRANFRVSFSITQAAAGLWDYGEDDLAERALALSDEDLRAVWRIAATYENPSYPLPIEGQRITHNHVNAIATIAYLEGRLRPLARTRRRPEKDRPARFTPRALDPSHDLRRD